MFSRRPVERLSSRMRESPRKSRASARWEPMKPAPPVISARMREGYRDVVNGSAAASEAAPTSAARQNVELAAISVELRPDSGFTFRGKRGV